MQEFFYGVAGFVTALLVALLPITVAYRKWGEAKSDVAIDNAQSGFYTHLAEQLQVNTVALNRAYDERNVLLHQYSETSARLTLLEDKQKRLEEVNAVLTDKLSERETEIKRLIVANEELGKDLRKKIEIIHDQYQTIASLTERVHHLELQLAKLENGGPAPSGTATATLEVTLHGDKNEK